MSDAKLKFRTHPVDFEVINSRMQTVTREMGITMERTSRSPIFFAAHDFSTAIFDKDGNQVALSEYLPVLLWASPFAIRAVLKYFGDDIHPGDLILFNDPYTLDGGNHLADWTITLPVFYKGEIAFWCVSKAHQKDIGGGMVGGYNPTAIDVLAEGMRIPPVKIYERGKLRKDVFDLIMANVRYLDDQRGDVSAMIGSAKIGERRLLEILDRYGLEVIKNFVLDLFEYTEALMRDEISNIPDGTYYGESISNESPSGQPAFIRCRLTVKGSELIIDLTESDGTVPGYINSTLANTYSCVFLALMTSVGKTIKYRAEGLMKPIRIMTKPGTICHCTYPAANGNCTNFVAKQIIEAVWDSLAKAIPEQVSAGWGVINGFNISVFDPRRNRWHSAPDWLAGGGGTGAMWGTDGWHAGAPQICSGTMLWPEVEVCELTEPLFRKKWELVTDSGGPGRWRGGTGTESIFVNEGGAGYLNQAAGHCRSQPGPVIQGGKPPPFNMRWIKPEKGTMYEASEEKTFPLARGDTIVCIGQGGCGVGDPLDRDVEEVKQDVINEFVSIKSAREDYGVVIDPQTFEVDEEQTRKLRSKMKAKSEGI